MMYSGHGTTLPCFEAGEKAIVELQKRFKPISDNNDAKLNIFA